MALSSRQPMTEVLRGWTVARGIPTGNDATVQNTRHPIPPGESMAELSQDIFRYRAGHPARCGPDSGGVWGPAGRLEEAVTPPRLLRYPLAERTDTRGLLPMEIHRHMPARECENDMGGRFTKYSLPDSHSMTPSPLVFSSLYASVSCPPLAERAQRRRTGATPLFDALVRAWAGVGFHKPQTALGGSLPIHQSLAGRRMTQTEYGSMDATCTSISSSN